MAAPPQPRIPPSSTASPSEPNPARPAASDRSKVATGSGKIAQGAATGTSAEAYDYSYGPQFPSPPFGHGPWGDHRGHWHGRHHGRGGHHSRPEYNHPSYSMYWEHPPPPGWHSHHMPPPPPHHHPPPPSPHAYAAANMFHHPPWLPQAPGAPGTGESTGPSEAGTRGEQSSVGPPSEAGKKQPLRPLRPRGGLPTASVKTTGTAGTAKTAGTAGTALERSPSLVAEIVSRVTQTLLASAGAQAKDGDAVPEAGQTDPPLLSVPEELLQSIHKLQEQLRHRGDPEGEARLLAQQKRRLRKGQKKPPALHHRSHSYTPTEEGASSVSSRQARDLSATPSQAANPLSAVPSVPSTTVAPAPVAPVPLFSAPPRVAPLPPFQPPSAPLAPVAKSVDYRAVLPAPALSQGAPSSSGAPDGSPLFVDLRPKKKRGPQARALKDPSERKALGRPRKPLLAMKCSKGEGLQGRKSGAIRKKLRLFGQKFQQLVAEQLYATTSDRIERTQMEEAITLILSHKVCGVRASIVMPQLLGGSAFSKERIEIPVEEAPPSKRRKGLKDTKAALGDSIRTSEEPSVEAASGEAEGAETSELGQSGPSEVAC